MLGNLGTNGVIAVLLGVFFIAWGVFGLANRMTDFFSIGISVFGAGCIIFGITDGFNDETPRGRLLFKIGILVFLLSAAILGYYFLRII